MLFRLRKFSMILLRLPVMGGVVSRQQLQLVSHMLHVSKKFLCLLDWFPTDICLSVLEIGGIVNKTFCKFQINVDYCFSRFGFLVLRFHFLPYDF